jgi:hypothetical protein
MGDDGRGYQTAGRTGYEHGLPLSLHGGNGCGTCWQLNRGDNLASHPAHTTCQSVCRDGALKRRQSDPQSQLDAEPTQPYQSLPLSAECVSAAPG